MNPTDEKLDWNTETSKESEGFTVLPEGTEVNFTVVEFKKATSKNGANMAKLELKCETDDGLSATCVFTWCYCGSCEWKSTSSSLVCRTFATRRKKRSQWGDGSSEAKDEQTRIGEKNGRGKDENTYDCQTS